MSGDPYKILGISPGSSEQELIHAYRTLAKKYHPDLNPDDPAAAERMMEINAAYERIKSGEPAPDEPLPPLDRAKRLLEVGEYEGAMEALSECVARGAEWNCLNAVAAYGMGDSAAALAFARRAVELQPNNVEYRHMLDQFESEKKGRKKSPDTAPVISCGAIFAIVLVIGLVCMFLFSRLFKGLRPW